MLSVRRAIQLAAVVGTLAGMAPAITSAAQPRTETAAKRCEWAAAHKAHLGAPFITDARGAYVAVLFVDQRDNYERFCLYAPHSGFGTSGQIRSANPNDPPPGANGIQHDSAGGSCDQTTGQAVGAMFGRVGTNVSAATFKFTNGASEHAVVKDGFYVVWWPWNRSPDAINVRTKSGATVKVQAFSGKAHPC